MSKNLITVSEAAKFLKVNDAVVSEMIAAKVFDVTKVGRSYRIDKNEIDEWLSKLSESEEEQFALRRTVCRFGDYFLPEYITLDFRAENKYEAIAEMSKFTKDIGLVRDHRWLYEVVVAREDLVSTAVGNNVALLHPRHMHPTRIKKPCILFGRVKEGVDFDAPDNKMVNLLFLLLMHNDKQHLFSLSYISRFLMHPDNVEILRSAPDAKTIVDALTTKVWLQESKKKSGK